jgi:hypothetical protein
MIAMRAIACAWKSASTTVNRHRAQAHERAPEAQFPQELPAHVAGAAWQEYK